MRSSNILFSKAVLALAGLMLLSGCENPYLVELKKEFGWTEGSMTRDGWLDSRKISPPDVWCYETIGQADCFDAPRPAETHRLMEKFEREQVELGAIPTPIANVQPDRPATELPEVESRLDEVPAKEVEDKEVRATEVPAKEDPADNKDPGKGDQVKMEPAKKDMAP